MKHLTIEDIERQIRSAIDAGDKKEIGRLGAMLDHLDQPRPTPDLLASALWYASVGLHVFPLTPGQKIPMPRTHGCKDATCDEGVIRTWWAATPEANIGIATGHAVDVIDIDGPTGVRSWAQLADTLPVILGHVSTPRAGGNHLYIAATGGARGNRAGIAPGVDYRGRGGYVVAPPSVNATGHAYRWITPIDITALGASA